MDKSAKVSASNELGGFKSSGLLQRKCVCGNHTMAGGACDTCLREKQNSPQRGQYALTSAGSRSPGRPLDPATRSSMETSFGQDFSGVRARGQAPPSLQTKLVLGQRGDKYEQEAEQVAERVTRTDHSARGGDAQEPQRGQDFGGVRVHADSAADASAKALGAHAYTVGEDIYFAQGQYQPETVRGRRLIAHELTHVVQQRSMQGVQMVQGFWAELGGAVVGAAAGALALASGGIGGVVAGILVGGLLGALGVSALKALFGGKDEDLDKTEPTDEGMEESDPAFKAKWQEQLVKGLDRLHSGGCTFPNREEWKYDKRYWEPASDPYFQAYKPKGVSPAKAVDELFGNLNLWDFDCALYPEVAWLYAYRHTLGASKFNSKFKDLVLRQHGTKGIKRTFYSLSDVGETRFNELWNEAPVGSKVMWTNRSPVTIGTAWRNENAIKRFKGTTWQEDRYDAHPLGANLLEEDVKKGLAENASDFPSQGSAGDKDRYVNEKIFRNELHLIQDKQP